MSYEQAKTRMKYEKEFIVKTVSIEIKDFDYGI